MKQYIKPRKSYALFGKGFVETIPSSRLDFFRGVFLANHLSSNDNLTRMKKRSETQTLRTGCSKAEPKISPVADPLPGGAGQP